ncbi:hypothetical protein BDY19DRAFT_1011514 [Irpex rosettiformis]|uniref:Uncharacterized protein n=1 Tax=Irpex rosettiformis TaxID=378272 RepID=A0ACB8TZX4_9APHY|nr:hypothetical protein BDY19DRAFT_1011514 [Irpex rosettiformis]
MSLQCCHTLQLHACSSAIVTMATTSCLVATVQRKKTPEPANSDLLLRNPITIESWTCYTYIQKDYKYLVLGAACWEKKLRAEDEKHIGSAYQPAYGISQANAELVASVHRQRKRCNASVQTRTLPMLPDGGNDDGNIPSATKAYQLFQLSRARTLSI